MISLPLGLAMSEESEGLVNLRPWSRNRCRINRRSDLVMFYFLIRSCREGSSGSRMLPSPVPGFYAGPFSQGRREPASEFSPVLDDGCEILEVYAIHVFRGSLLIRQNMDHCDLRKRSRDRDLLDTTMHKSSPVVVLDALFELRGQRYELESGSGLQKLVVLSSRPRICHLRHRDDVAEQLAEAALDRTLQIVLLAATERHRVSGGGITGVGSLDDRLNL